MDAALPPPQQAAPSGVATGAEATATAPAAAGAGGALRAVGLPSPPLEGKLRPAATSAKGKEAEAAAEAARAMGLEFSFGRRGGDDYEEDGGDGPGGGAAFVFGGPGMERLREVAEGLRQPAGLLGIAGFIGAKKGAPECARSLAGATASPYVCCCATVGFVRVEAWPLTYIRPSPPPGLLVCYCAVAAEPAAEGEGGDQQGRQRLPELPPLRPSGSSSQLAPAPTPGVHWPTKDALQKAKAAGARRRRRGLGALGSAVAAPVRAAAKRVQWRLLSAASRVPVLAGIIARVAAVRTGSYGGIQQPHPPPLRPFPRPLSSAAPCEQGGEGGFVLCMGFSHSSTSHGGYSFSAGLWGSTGGLARRGEGGRETQGGCGGGRGGWVCGSRRGCDSGGHRWGWGRRRRQRGRPRRARRGRGLPRCSRGHRRRCGGSRVAASRRGRVGSCDRLPTGDGAAQTGPAGAHRPRGSGGDRQEAIGAARTCAFLLSVCRHRRSFCAVLYCVRV